MFKYTTSCQPLFEQVKTTVWQPQLWSICLSNSSRYYCLLLRNSPIKKILGAAISHSTDACAVFKLNLLVFTFNLIYLLCIFKMWMLLPVTCYNSYAVKLCSLMVSLTEKQYLNIPRQTKSYPTRIILLSMSLCFSSNPDWNSNCGIYNKKMMYTDTDSNLNG